MNDAEDAKAMCPYYCRFRDREIQCESCVRRARQVFVFYNHAEALKHKRLYCDSYSWRLCPYAVRLDEDRA